MKMTSTTQWEAIFKVNGIDYGSYIQDPNETIEDFKDNVYRTEAEITREAYREYKFCSFSSKAFFRAI